MSQPTGGPFVTDGTWSVFAEKVVAERDAAIAKLAENEERYRRAHLIMTTGVDRSRVRVEALERENAALRSGLLAAERAAQHAKDEARDMSDRLAALSVDAKDARIAELEARVRTGRQEVARMYRWAGQVKAVVEHNEPPRDRDYNLDGPRT